MKFPLLLPGVDIRKGKKLGKDGEAILNKPLGSLPDVRLHVPGDLVEVVQLVPDHSDQIAH